jgi:hypothetical protein
LLLRASSSRFQKRNEPISFDPLSSASVIYASCLGPDVPGTDNQLAIGAVYYFMRTQGTISSAGQGLSRFCFASTVRYPLQFPTQDRETPCINLVPSASNLAPLAFKQGFQHSDIAPRRFTSLSSPRLSVGAIYEQQLHMSTLVEKRAPQYRQRLENMLQQPQRETRSS